MTDKPSRPTVNIVKPTKPRGMPGEVLAYVEGRGGQRVRIYLGTSDDVLMVFILHDDRTVLDVSEVKNVPWIDGSIP